MVTELSILGAQPFLRGMAAAQLAERQGVPAHHGAGRAAAVR